MFAFPNSEDKRAASPCAHEGAGKILVNHGDSISAHNLLKSEPQGLDHQCGRQARSSSRKRVQLLANQMRENLGVGLGKESVPVA